MSRRIHWVYVVINAEPDVELDSVWESEKEAQDRCHDMDVLWPGMGYYVQTIEIHKAKAPA